MIDDSNKEIVPVADEEENERLKKERRRAQLKAYRKENAEKLRLKREAWCETNRDRMKAYREENAEKQAARDRARFQANPEKNLASNAAWRKANEERRKVYKATLRASRKAAGLCVECSLPAVPTRTLCSECAARAAEARARFDAKKKAAAGK